MSTSYKKILCPVDFSESSHVAFEQAGGLAWQMGGKLTLMHVYQVPLQVPPGLIDPSYINAIVGEAETNLAKVKKEAVAKGLKDVEIVNQAGSPWERICAVAKEGKYDLIVLGTHGRTGLKHVFLGSQAERVVRHAPCPVLVVRPVAR